MSRHDRRAAGRKSRTASNSAGMATPAALYEAGLAHMKAGRFLDAQISCQQALAVDSNQADALHLMGLLSFQAKQYDHAVEWIARAIRQDPRPAFLASLGGTLQQQGRYRGSAQRPGQGGAAQAGRWRIMETPRRHSGAARAVRSCAVELSARAKAQSPSSRRALQERGSPQQIGRHEEAIAHLDLGHELSPNHVPTLQACARTLYNLNRFEESVSFGRRAYQLDPDDADTCNNLALGVAAA